MTEQQKHYSALELAGLAGMPGTKRGTALKANKEKWPHRPRAGCGGGREYPLSCLPAETQAALANQLVADLRTRDADLRTECADAPPPDNQAEQLAAYYESRPEKLKAEAAARLALVRQFEQLVADGFNRAAAIATLIEQRGISAATLTRALARIKGKPDHLWLYLLVATYTGRTSKAEMSAEAWEILRADYLRPERPAARACIHRLREMKRDWALPSDRTMERKLDAIPRAMSTLARHGPKALKRLYPAQQRSKSALAAMQIVNADGYKHNLWVRFPDGEIVRAKTWYWQDVYSSKVLAWRTDKTEHTDMIRLSFGDLVKQWGVPEAAVLDNTLAAANKTMSGGVKHRFRFKVKEEESDGVFKLLGVDLHWATPEHGQAKPVERAFGVGGVGEYIDKAPEFSGAWTGGSVADKPDYDGKTRAIDLADLQKGIAREIAAYNAREGRRGAMAQGRSFDAVFEESYKLTPIRRATEAQSALWLLATEPVRAARDGAITLDAGRVVGERLANRYWHPDMVDYAGRMLAARFDPQHLHDGVRIYTADGRFICFADCDRPAGFNDQLAGRERNRARNAWMRGQKIALKAEQRMDVLDVVKARAGAAGDAVIPPPAAPARTVIRGEFRTPIEQPADADMIAFEARFAQPKRAQIHQLLTDEQRLERWIEIKARCDAKEPVSEDECAFCRAFRNSAFYRIKQKAEREFEERLAKRA